MRLWTVLALNVVLVAGLVVVGASAHSTGVLAEGVDYLADAAAIGVALLALRSRRARATAWATMVNAGWLLVVSVLIVSESARRLVLGVRQVHGVPVLIAS